MAHQEHQSSLEETLKHCGAFITYVPLRTEAPFRDFVPLADTTLTYEIAPRAALDPFAEAQKARAAVGSERAAVLMPGRKFDSAGTRFGQGGGWYDRFLSAVPAPWLRIGFCYQKQFSSEPLERQEWDQIMDYVCVVQEDGTVRVYETRAR